MFKRNICRVLALGKVLCPFKVYKTLAAEVCIGAGGIRHVRSEQHVLEQGALLVRTVYRSYAPRGTLRLTDSIPGLLPRGG